MWVLLESITFRIAISLTAGAETLVINNRMAERRMRSTPILICVNTLILTSMTGAGALTSAEAKCAPCLRDSSTYRFSLHNFVDDDEEKDNWVNGRCRKYKILRCACLWFTSHRAWKVTDRFMKVNQ